ESASNLFFRLTAHLTERARDLRISTQRRVAAGEDEAKTVVLDAIVSLWVLLNEALERRPIRGIESRAAAKAIDRLESPSRYQPCTRIPRHAILGPCLHRSRERVVKRLLGQARVAGEGKY